MQAPGENPTLSEPHRSVSPKGGMAWKDGEVSSLYTFVGQDSSKEPTQLDRDCTPKQTGDKSSDP